ncbi:MAG: PKD domain-containing protein [Bacteroidales bacterium]|nr:PKD domain-containing protein [Bacteroidales bacterium]
MKKKVKYFILSFFVINNLFTQNLYAGLPEDCLSHFVYETQDSITFVFEGFIDPAWQEVYFWDFGDGTTDTGKIVIHTFSPVNNTYTVCLTAVTYFSGTADSCVAEYCDIIVTGGQPECQADFEYETIPGTAQTYQFIDLSTGNYNNWLWEFGDGTTSSEPLPFHYYEQPGWYDVCLTISDNAGNCNDTYCDSVLVLTSGDCEASFQYEENPGNPFLYSFFDSSVGNITSWFWDFGDGEFSFEQNPQHLYPQPGQFLVTLEISDSVTGCFDFHQEFLIIDTTGIICENWFIYETMDHITFDFFGESLPLQANVWIWDFGDGQTGYGPLITHTYDSIINQVVTVCLTTLFYNPSGDTCVAVSCQEILVGNQGMCEANFDYNEIPGQPLTLEFLDLSTGDLISWYWDFDDGTHSFEQNPVHEFLYPGIFEVCLTVEGHFGGIVCTDIYCVFISLADPLAADFISILDTISGEPRHYQFTDLSIGEPDFWYWDFGDGFYSDESSPVHTYELSGTYTVCLEVSKVYQNGSNNSATFCADIIVPDYFYLGGQVYTGNVPLNNPVHVGDTGIAYLYRKYEEILFPVDTIEFWEFGFYWFVDVRQGNYIVNVELTEQSTNYLNFFPTYSENSLTWQEADPIPLLDDLFEQGVFMVEVADSVTGPGIISGSVNIVDSGESDDVEVLLFNDDFSPVTYTETNSEGGFSLHDLKLGTYYLYAEKAGYFTEPVIVTIDDSDPEIENVVLEITNSPPIGIEEQSGKDVLSYELYPNPFRESFYLKAKTDRSLVIYANMYNISGQIIFQQEFYLPVGSGLFTINVPEINRGVYIITLKTADDRLLGVKKLIKE